MLWIHKLRATFIRVNVGSLFICLVYRHRFIYLFIHSFIHTFHTFLFHFSRDYNQLADFNLKLYIAFSAFEVNSNIRNWLKFVEIEDKVNSCGVFIYEKACNGKWANGQMGKWSMDNIKSLWRMRTIWLFRSLLFEIVGFSATFTKDTGIIRKKKTKRTYNTNRLTINLKIWHKIYSQK